MERSRNGLLTSLIQSSHLDFSPQIGMIERQEVDVGVTSFFATVKRQEVVDFSPIIDYAEYARWIIIWSLY